MKKMSALGLALLLALSLFTGCASKINETLNSWIGRSSRELITAWGPPSEVFSDGQGGEVFVYYENRSWIQPGTSTTYANANAYGNTAYGTAMTVYTPTVVRSYTAYRAFFINNEGTIYSYSWRGL